jgi:NADH-quinone oxidoreductase subunit H
MADFWTTGLSWAADRDGRAEPVLLVVLLIAIAYILLPTARSGRRCRCGAAPTWSAPSACCSPSPTLLKFVLKEPIIPAGANKGVFLLAPLVTCVLALAPGR